MSLPSPNLDDRQYQDIVDEAKRLIPKYCPTWTNHNLSDPGIALIELFAWMSEMFLYRLNQVPERYYTKFLDLVGIKPFPPSAAKTDVTFWLTTALDGTVAIPAGTEVSTVRTDGGEEVVFTTTADLGIHQPELINALTTPAGDEESYTSVWTSLRVERESVTCFTSFPIKPGDAFYLGFDTSLAGNVLRLDVEASIEGIGIRPENPPLRWEVWAGTGWLEVPVHADSTGGLNCNGSVVLLIPLAHDPVTLGTHRAYWLRARLLKAELGQPEYKASPQIRKITAASMGGTVPAEHSQPVGLEILGRSTGEPAQELQVRHRPVLPRVDGERVRIITDDGADDWLEVDDFTMSTEKDLHYTWDDASGTIRFGPRIRYGDGRMRQHGAVPPAGAQIAVTGYRHGGGAVGNVGKGTVKALRTSIPYVAEVFNIRPATGGVDAESVSEAKQRGPLTLRTGERAVTATDYVRLTREASPAVKRARCLPPKEAGGPVRLLVVPDVQKPCDQQKIDDFVLPDDLIDTISRHLDERRMIGTTIEIGTPSYQGVTVAVLVKAMPGPGQPANVVRQRVLDALYRYVNPLVGGPTGNGWDFDTHLNGATVAQLIETVEGVASVEELLLFPYDLRYRRRHGTGKDIVRLADDALFLSAGHQVVVR